ncbi:trimeric intracellular cation channel family protein [Phyllobacterium bourgognense]|uniref:Putative membrane protein YeiH n=1 Tax=Phyllobacterium bourgognense TaxID=314236 RepID=A0A368YZ67_9HYPH|nr:trimeric intracellular cation channel family protein [Phyllobacterium bourgognense]RCW84526.1 putative membrane protein YeiH [Phyllobacterium bourgognense]
MTMIQLFNYAGIFVFAATGALAASRRQLDIIAFVFLAAVTGIGGGTLRDLILGVPVFWVEDPGNLMVCAAAAILVYFSANLLESRYRVLLWLDALGLAAYSVIGAAKSLALGFDSTIAIVTGIMTATFGGILRDIISGEPSVLMRREIYVTAALAGSVTYIVLHSVAAGPGISALVAALAAFAVRGGALYFGWALPTYHKPGRTPEELKREGYIRSE